MNKELAPTEKNKLTAALKKRDLSPEDFKILKTIIHPGASDEGALLAYDYCKVRKLDPMKKVCHVIKARTKDKEGKWVTYDSIWMGIAELRITAFRTGEYVGQDKPEYGPVIEESVGGTPMKYPEWCKITVYRFMHNEARAFTAIVYWKEAYKSKGYKDQAPNDMWQSRAIGQLEKCTEAAALRKAFPEEIGSEYILEEANIEPAGDYVEGEVIKDKPEKPSEKPSEARQDALEDKKEPVPLKTGAGAGGAGHSEHSTTMPETDITFDIVNSYGQLTLRHTPGTDEDKEKYPEFNALVHECEDIEALDKFVENNAEYINRVNEINKDQWKEIMTQISFMRNSINEGPPLL